MNTPIETISARSLVKAAMARTGSVDWREISESVIDALPAAQYEEVLRQVLPSYVRLVAKDDRVPGPVMPPPAPPVEPVKASKVRTVKPTPRKATQPRHASHKVAAVHADWQRRLTEIYTAANGDRKHLADMGYQDLLALAARGRQHARATMARASGFQSLADALKQHKVDKVADLPHDVTKRLVAAV